ncbi:DUF742 domain-containing protein [Actinomadura sp. ATCC 31491]|uniref:DUF742 domain-containing protein n=1 Tax=Actinomadura luzonensis TaxID=2805427 RepID=A0ABT0FQA9_9ACTN|nr:DUF742 domain-containing protein [Actinomadura luzonensis]MCK2214469.1 DUF742 domain-containing protein [Actinomadura luzonensis]
MSREHEWVDEEAGPVVRPYAVARGRTRPASSALDLLANVVSTGLPAPAHAELSAQHRRVLGCLSGGSRPVVELASEVGLPVGVLRVLLGDLLEYGLVSVRPQRDRASSPTESLLREVINGLRAL